MLRGPPEEAMPSDYVLTPDFGSSGLRSAIHLAERPSYVLASAERRYRVYRPRDADTLASRFADVEEGRGGIKVDGYDLRDVTRASLVTQMSMVLQEPFLFSGSVRDNIKFNHPDVSDEQMVKAADAVGAHDFISKLPDGYDTEVAELGVNLSLGQRQLVSFARAIVSEPRILILDEATASVDSETELKIQRAHRLSTVRDADRILVMDGGCLVEEGDHDTLLAADERYAQLHRANRLLEG